MNARLETNPTMISRSHAHNNFDLIRLLAALQVAVWHGLDWLKLSVGLLPFIKMFPGVPIFFCVSGYLIAQSAERNLDNLNNYAKSRILRIYPALILCVTLSAIVMDYLGVFKGVSHIRVFAWYLGNIIAGGGSINPDFLRHFGVGVWNGSLWTISVELSFYIVLPIIFLAARHIRIPLDVILSVLLVASFTTLALAHGFEANASTKTANAIEKIVWFSLPGNLWMFLFGTLAYIKRSRLLPWLEGKVFWWLAGYVIANLIINSANAYFTKTNSWQIATHFLTRGTLALLTLSAAFSFGTLSKRLLKSNDISYGVYLWHMPVYNFLLTLGYAGAACLLIGLTGTIVLATGSWFFLERHALKFRKRKPAMALNLSPEV